MKKLVLILNLVFICDLAVAWEVDFSRRRKQVPTDGPVSVDEPVKAKTSDFVSKISKRETVTDRQELVILNTQKGFVPSQVRLKKGAHYMVHVVNVNKNNKNASFMLDAYAQHHSTYFGETKSFKLDPDKEGVFEFQCPETSAEGKLVVYGPQAQPVQVERSTAAEE